ncbi:glycosyltransferase [Clostridium sp. SYSU_GA19001]|uniref:glycosyltransferase n=1 Tax=Clostridium caldaquaticum TaxID=2940653 RepID=UPI0020777B83|nr:glycosyltransferase [Clostridium caldaquaticum]MCM8711281.1 glycosyltransferase [Clostridium caldaquaticum]
MIKKQLHILILPSWYPISSMPLSGIFFKEQVQALRRAGVKAGIVYPETRGLTNFSIKNLLNNHFHITKELEDSVMTFRLHSWNMFPKMPKLQAIQWVYETKRLVKKYIEINGKPDIIHAHSTLWGGYTALLLSKEYNIPYIITEHHSNFANGLIKDWQVPYIQKSFIDAKKLIAVSSPFAKILQHYDKGKNIVVIPNAINTDFFYFKKKNAKKNLLIYL